jgi:CRP-like cAMP-binding protein
MIEPGDMFGEVALLYKTSRTATVRTITYSKIAKLDPLEFE